ncbi:MAG: hypothetical protein ACLFQX_13750, partial [Candidatus Kapaibacterium sp.]
MKNIKENNDGFGQKFNNLLNRYTLRFNGHMEEKYIDSMRPKFIAQLRIAMIVAIILFGLFGILDIEIVPAGVEAIWFIRYRVYIPVLVAALLLSYTSFFQKHIQPLASFMIFFSGAAILSMFAVHPVVTDQINFTGLLLIIFFGYAFLRIRFIWASLAGWSILAGYFALEAFFVDNPFVIFITNTVYLLTSNILGMVAAYYIEFSARKDFYSNYQLEKEKEHNARPNLYLEDKIAERTSELRRANTELERQMQERVEAEEALRKSEQ